MLNIEVIYATLDNQELIKLEVEKGASVEQCIQQSGVLEQFPEIDLKVNKVGIFSQIRTLDHAVHEGDRIEIYRPLQADPKAVRRARAEAAQKNEK